MGARRRPRPGIAAPGRGHGCAARAERRCQDEQRLHGRHGRRRSSPSGAPSGDPGTTCSGTCSSARDKQGKELPDHNIVAQCLTFLIAGHETTSGLLSFAISYLLKHPDVVARAQEEVDEVLGTDPSVPPTVAQVQPTRATSGRSSTRPCACGRPRPRSPARPVRRAHGRRVGALHAGHVDPGPDPDAAPAARRSGARTPRSSTPTTSAPSAGPRSRPTRSSRSGPGSGPASGASSPCRRRRWCSACCMQRFEFVDHANYQLKIKESLTLKPEGLTITVRPRTGRTWGACARGSRRVSARIPPSRDPRAWPHRRRGPARHAAAGALRLQPRHGRGHRHPDRPGGDRPRLHRPLGRARRRTSTTCRATGAVVVVTSSYNGQPPDNAGRFCTWIDERRHLRAAGVRYTVFGCGNRDWAATYQAVPTRIDAALEARGATRVHPRGEGDARGDFDGQFEAWYAGLWDAPGLGARARREADDRRAGRRAPAGRPELEQRRTASPSCSLYRGPAGDRAGQPRAHRTGGQAGRPLGAPPRDRRCPAGTSYAAGDHLGVLPRNDGRPDQPGDRPVRPRRGPVRHAHRDRRRPDPPAHRRALPAARHPRPAASSCRTSRAAQDIATMAAHMPEGPARDELLALAGTDDAGAGPLPGPDRGAAPHAARPARGAPRVRPAVRGVPRPAAAAAPALLLDLLVADGRARTPR